MKKLLAVFAFAFAITSFAEPTFQQIEGLINNHQYQAAELGLEQIIQSHPQSAKAFYAMAQAQAGLGNLEKAQFALNKAKGLDPELKFASSSNIESLEQAITPQTAKIEVVTESHFWRDFMYFVLFCVFAVALVFFYGVYARKRDEDDGNKGSSGGVPPITPVPPTPRSTYTPTPSATSYTSTPSATSAPSMASPTINATPAPVYHSAPQPAVVNNNYGGGNDGFVTGMLVGEMLNSHSHETVIIERPAPVYVEPAPVYTAPQRDTSWDTPSTPSRSSSWDSDDSSSSKSSSSWFSDSSRDSSDSWSSSSSDSGSSWSDSSSSDSSSSDW